MSAQTSRRPRKPKNLPGLLPDGARIAHAIGASYRLQLEPESWTGTAPHERRIPGKTVKFSSHTAIIPPDWQDLFEATDAYRRHAVGYAGDPAVVYKEQFDHDTHRGALTPQMRKIQSAPVDGWDAFPDDALRDVIESGRIDPMACLAWEMAHKRRPWVIMALGEVIGTPEDAELARVIENASADDELPTGPLSPPADPEQGVIA